MSLRTRLASQSTIIFGVRLFGAGLIFLAQAAIARIWGSAVLGEYLLFIATINLAAMVLPLGFNTVGTYFSAEYRARGQGQLLWKFMVRAYAHVFVIGAVAAVCIAPLSSLAGANFDIIGGLWMPAALLMMATAVIFINSSILIGLKRPYAGFFADGLFRPMLVIAAFLLALIFGQERDGLSAMIWILAVGYAGVALVHCVFVVQSVKDVATNEQDTSIAETSRWWRFAAPWVLIALATDFFFDIDLLLLSGMMDKEMLAVFGVCTRIFSLISFGVIAVYAVSLPDIFEADAKDDRAKFRRKVGDANLVAAGLSIVMFVGILVAGPLVLKLFGPAFAVGAGPLCILSLVLVVRSVFGPASMVLSIHDRPWASLPSIACGMVSLVVANYVLVPVMGLMGAALAALIAIGVWSGLLWIVARRIAGIDVSIFPRLRGLLRIRAIARQ